jgi:hypothetical protein
MIFGDVAGILNPLMDHYDVLTPLRHERTWGPFTAYRNTPETTELFRLIDGDLYDALNNSNALSIDEWGVFGRVYHLSMSSVIARHKKDGRATRHILPSNNPVFFCHYQSSKREIAEILSNTDQEAILRADLVMWSANSGLTVFDDPM